MQALRSFFAPPASAPLPAADQAKPRRRTALVQHIEVIGGAAASGPGSSAPLPPRLQSAVSAAATPLVLSPPRLPAELRLLIVAAALAELLAAPPSPARHHAILSLALAERAALALVLSTLLRTPHLRGTGAVEGLERVMRKAIYREAARGTRRLVVSSAQQQAAHGGDRHAGLFAASSSAQAFASQIAAPLASLLGQLVALQSLVLAAPPRALLTHVPPSLAELTCTGSVYGSDVLPLLFSRPTPLRRLTLLGPRLYLPAATLRLLAAQPQLAEVTLFLPRRDVDVGVLLQSASLRSVTIVAHETKGTTGYRGGLEGRLQTLTRRKGAGAVQVRLVTVRSAVGRRLQQQAAQGSASAGRTRDAQASVALNAPQHADPSLQALEEWFFARCAQGLSSFDSCDAEAPEARESELVYEEREQAQVIDARFGVQCEVLQWDLEEDDEAAPPEPQESATQPPRLPPERMEALDLGSSDEEQLDDEAHDYDYLE
ncbi:hypothetical protein FA09DRAFT_327747 [Tilletiopsis washingtonensis]|uniref:Uncharacterized protein n=1 Tax=Tilletiopsis washingtonensis TaxID=58919 RepID=A0A316ZJ43_9BASI|nr:hypothetical protein FA09DRAFT_327747 [Tilletiopsis washingtonensis]PWO00284.1 hypothetical protein FA09DRAFT_327747 [Tilletiopsis washingtonensis]